MLNHEVFLRISIHLMCRQILQAFDAEADADQANREVRLHFFFYAHNFIKTQTRHLQISCSFLLLKVSVCYFTHIKAHLIVLFTIIHVPLISIFYQPIEGGDVGKDWRTITFRQDHAIHLKKSSHCVFICYRANHGECQHAVCHECHEKHSKAQKRSRGSVLREDELIKSCHHELCNLQICADLWWCTKEHLGGPQWLDRPRGCAFCERMFNVVAVK